MRKILMAGLALLWAAGAVSAQSRNAADAGPGGRPGFTPPAAVTISGNLGISQGMVSLESDGELYYVMGLNRFTGFIDGLKEGAAVGLTGYAFETPRLSGAKVFRVTELRLNGKSYDLGFPAGQWKSGHRGQDRNRGRDWERSRGFRHREDFRSFNGPSGCRDFNNFNNRRFRGETGPRPGPR
jgi:hypothetical protein